MAVALTNHLGRMPEELLLEIIKQPCLSECDLISLARTNRRHYRVAISPAYQAHIERNYGLAIYWAIENGRHSTLERLIENDVDVNMLDNDGTALTVDDLEMSMGGLKSTKAYQAVIEFECAVRVTPLAWAAFRGQDSVVEYLLDNHADLEMPSYRLCSCCHELLFCCHSDAFPTPPHFQDTKSDYGYNNYEDAWSPLHYAICTQNASTAQLLLARGADASNLGGAVPAILVATHFELDGIVNYLMEHGPADINATNHLGVTALHLAHLAGRYDLVDRYVAWGADINLSFADENGPWTIFSMACAEALFRQALKYLTWGADPRFVLKDQGRQNDWDVYTVWRLLWHAMVEYGLRRDESTSAFELEYEIISRCNADP